MKALYIILICTINAFALIGQGSTTHPNPNDKVKALIIKKVKDSDNTVATACYNIKTATMTVKSELLFTNHPGKNTNEYITDIYVASRLIVYKNNKSVFEQTHSQPHQSQNKLFTPSKTCDNCRQTLFALENLHKFNLSEYFHTSINCDDLINNYTFVIELWALGYNSKNPGPTQHITIEKGCHQILPSECFINGTDFIREKLFVDCQGCE
jgi:hypothetical protein